ncbi:MAG: hypothetical protein HOP22_13490 [Nitrospiraceae bacterium]|nr:hypothetical protein [Nitrospiraceae bacterium]
MGEGQGDGGEHGHNEFIADINAIVMGRTTFEKVLAFAKWYYGNKRVARTEAPVRLDCLTR